MKPTTSRIARSLGDWTWWPPRQPPVAKIDHSIPLFETHSLDAHLLVAAGPIEVVSIAPSPLRPGVVSVPLGGLAIKSSGYTFPQPTLAERVPAMPAAPLPADRRLASPRAAAPPTITRLKPPADVIKLADRLFYVLQPPLETVVAGQALDFPFHPFPYQLEGIAFLYPRYAAILADEMGLGKSMQAITAIRLLLHAGEIRTVLLVCPKPLITNWQREFHLWAPELPLTVIEGERAKRLWQWRQADSPVKMANYELLQRDRAVLAEPGLHFDLVVLDESQRIKNRECMTSQVVRSISRGRNWALTGTPVENSADDLVGIFEFLSPGHLSPTMKPRRMGKLAGDYVLRRTKDRVLTELPPKMFRDADVALTPEQRETYRLAEDEGVLRLTEMGEGATIQHVFELVLRLKQICNFDPATGASAKLERLSADLEEVAASGRKALVFSQWVGTLDKLARRLARYHPLAYHGGVASRKRDGVLQEFKESPKRQVLLISYGVGSLGLNLQFAQYVFLFDRWWNPAVEDQAINRVHRIGAAGPVTVTRFLALATIEERINQILDEKRELFDTIFSDVQPHRHGGLTRQEIFGLFRLKCPSGPLDLAA
ncbi:MAG TPA: DEAD/DEAH box helicase [Pirellulales bacterium]|nr:DEAD/DEAH box helicase [Pirellulales bacterium]